MTLPEKEIKRQRWLQERVFKQCVDQAINAYYDELRSQKVARAYSRQRMKQEMRRLVAETATI